MALGFIKKAYRYAGTKAHMAFDARADPKVLIQQAMEVEQKRHTQLVNAAAAVIGSKRQSQMNLTRLIREKANAESSIERALLLAQTDHENASDYHDAANRLASQLVALEDRIEEAKSLHEAQEVQAQQATSMVEDSLAHMQESQSERAKLLSQVEGAKMQRVVAARMSEAAQLTASGTPTLSEIRTRVESDMAQALGTAELAESVGYGSREVDAKLRRAALTTTASARVAEIEARLQAEGKLPALGA